MKSSNNEIHWRAVEFHYHAKDALWPVAVIGGASLIALFALWQKNILFFIFTLIAAALMLVWGRRHPRHLRFALDERGLWIEEKLHPYKRFTGFALHENSLQMHAASRITPLLTVVIPAHKERDIREYLLAFLPEVEYTESVTEALAHWLRF